jgi:hypothetical protein
MRRFSIFLSIVALVTVVAVCLAGYMSGGQRSKRAFEAMRRYGVANQHAREGLNKVMASDEWVKDPGFYPTCIYLFEPLREVRDPPLGLVEVKIDVYCIGRNESFWARPANWAIEVNGREYRSIKVKGFEGDQKVTDGDFYMYLVYFNIPTERIEDGFQSFLFRLSDAARMQWQVAVSGPIAKWPEARKWFMKRHEPAIEVYYYVAGRIPVEFSLVPKQEK